MSGFVCGNDVTTALLTRHEKTVCFAWYQLCTCIYFLTVYSASNTYMYFCSNSSFKQSELECLVLCTLRVLKFVLAFQGHNVYMLTM